MKKFAGMLIALTMVGTLTFTGCSSSSTSGEGASSIKEGSEKMITVTEDLKSALAAGDEKKIKELGPKLEEAWQGFEDGVKENNKEMYEKVEASLSPTIAATEADQIDKDAINKFNDELAATLKELAGK